MYLPKFELLSFSFLPPERKKIVLRALLEALCTTDWQWLEWYREQYKEKFPSLYDYAPQYVLKVRPGGLDSWQDIPDTIALGSGDCKDFAMWRVAELRARGIDAVYPVIKEQTVPDPNGVEPPMTVYHIQVSVNGEIEDPSAILGMPTNVSYDDLRGNPLPMAAGHVWGPSVSGPNVQSTTYPLYLPGY